jgi:quercetin 2,3-dioxygenase
MAAPDRADGLAGAELRSSGGLPLRYPPVGGRNHRPPVRGGIRWLALRLSRRGESGPQQAGTHTALMIDAEETTLEVMATMDTDLVLFLIDRGAKFSREGTMSG